MYQSFFKASQFWIKLLLRIFKNVNSTFLKLPSFFINNKGLPNNKKQAVLATLLLFLAGIACGQSYYFRHYQVENGLSNNAVICSVQDRQGFLWFGTKDGLNRFDGYSFKVFRANPDQPGSIGGNFVTSLYEDRDGILWAGTEKGLYRYDATAESFSLLKTNSVLPVTDIRMDGMGNLWFISDFTLVKYNDAKKESYVLFYR